MEILDEVRTNLNDLVKHQEEVCMHIHSILTRIAEGKGDISFRLTLIWPTFIGNEKDRTITLVMMSVSDERMAHDDLTNITFYTEDGKVLNISDFLSVPLYLWKVIDTIIRTGKPALTKDDLSTNELEILSKRYLSNIPDNLSPLVKQYADKDMFEHADAWTVLDRAVNKIRSINADSQEFNDNLI